MHCHVLNEAKKQLEATIQNNSVGTHGTQIWVGIMKMGIMMQFSNYFNSVPISSETVFHCFHISECSVFAIVHSKWN